MMINPYTPPAEPKPSTATRWCRAPVAGTFAFACIAAATCWVFGVGRPPHLSIFLIVAVFYWLWLVGIAFAAQWVAQTRAGTTFVLLMLTTLALVIVTAYSWLLFIPVDWGSMPVFPFIASGAVGGLAIVVSALRSRSMANSTFASPITSDG